MLNWQTQTKKSTLYYHLVPREECLKNNNIENVWAWAFCPRAFKIYNAGLLILAQSCPCCLVPLIPLLPCMVEWCRISPRTQCQREWKCTEWCRIKMLILHLCPRRRVPKDQCCINIFVLEAECQRINCIENVGAEHFVPDHSKSTKRGC